MRDVIAQTIYPFHKPDWLAQLEERGEYVYDSGCLSCHAALKEATKDDPAALAAHKAYFDGDVGEGCVECHSQVGHKNLKIMLADHFEEVRLTDTEDGPVVNDDQAPAPEEHGGADEPEPQQQDASGSTGSRQGA